MQRAPRVGPPYVGVPADGKQTPYNRDGFVFTDYGEYGPKAKPATLSPTTFGIAARNDIVFLTDPVSHVVRIVEGGRVRRVAGQPGEAGSVDSLSSEGVMSPSLLNRPMGVTVDHEGVLYVADYGNRLVRRLNRQGELRTLAGKPAEEGMKDGSLTEATFVGPVSLTLDATVGRHLYVVDAKEEEQVVAVSTKKQQKPAPSTTTLVLRLNVRVIDLEEGEIGFEREREGERWID